MHLDSPDSPVVPAITPTSPASTVTKQSSYRWAFCYSLILTVLIGFIVNPTRLHESVLLSDQGTYITAARNFLDTGTIEATFRPVHLSGDNKRNFSFMPGYSLILAGVYAVFGYGALQSALPTAFFFLLSCMLCYHLGLRLYSSFVGWIAMIILSSYPFMHVLSFTAMSDVTIMTGMLVSLTLFLHLSPRWQVLIGWTLPALAFLFRETSAVVIFPMCAILLNRHSVAGRWKSVFCFFFAALTAIAILYLSPINARQGFFYSKVVYDDNVELLESQPLGSPYKPQLGVFFDKLLEHAGNNFMDLIHSLKPDLRGVEWIFILSSIPLGVWHFIRYRDYFMLSISLATVLLVIALVLLYMFGHIGKRHTLALTPLASIVCAQTLARLISVNWQSRFLVLFTIIAAPSALFLANREWKAFHIADEYHDVMLQELETVHHDNTTLLMGSFETVVNYLVHHYPVRALSLSYTKTRLQTALASNNITTIVIPISDDSTFDSRYTKLTKGDLESLGFKLSRSFVVMKQNYQVYQRK